MVAVSCNPYEESKEHGRPQAAKKSPVGSFLMLRVAAPSIRACLGRHVRLAGRCPNNSSLHRPLAAVVVVAGPNDQECLMWLLPLQCARAFLI